MVRAEEPTIAGARTTLESQHRADVEQPWFRRRRNGEDAEHLYRRHGAPEAAFEEIGSPPHSR